MSENIVAVLKGESEPAATTKKASKKNATKKASKKAKDAIVTENSRGVRAKWRSYGACALLRWCAVQEWKNPQVRFVFDNIGLSQVNDFTIGCQCGATRSALAGTVGKRGDGTPITKAEAAAGVSFRGDPAKVSREDAAFLRAVLAKMPKPKA